MLISVMKKNKAGVTESSELLSKTENTFTYYGWDKKYLV